MSSRERELDSPTLEDVIETTPREKRRGTRSDRGAKDRDRDHDRDRETARDRDRDKERDRDRYTDRDRHRDRDRDHDRDRDGDRARERDGERDRDKDREHRHRSSRSFKYRSVTDSDLQSSSHRKRRVKDKDRQREKDRERQHRHRDRTDREIDGSSNGVDGDAPDTASEMTGDIVPELSRFRAPRPYSSFSKQHSRESVAVSREDLSQPAPEAQTRRTDPLTPEATDLGAGDAVRRSKSADHSTANHPAVSCKDERPPSPPDTNLSGHKEHRRSETPTSIASRERDRARDADDDRPRSRTSRASRSTSNHDERSKVSTKSRTSSQATFLHKPSKGPAVELKQDSERKVAPESVRRDWSAKRPNPFESNLSPKSAVDSSPNTPTGTPKFPPPPPILPHEKPGPAEQNIRRSEVVDGSPSDPSQVPTTDFGPPPPPPPPPPIGNVEVPKVNYLTQNGGLPKPITKFFLDALPRQNGTRPSNPPLSGCETLFAPFFNILDQYQIVLENHGSVAVATGHKTIARRILDRLDNVFTRDLPEDGCTCIICEKSDQRSRGLGWGEVLERYKGDNPTWPPFDLADLGSKGIEESAELPPRPDSPVKMDPDIAEEFRGHYLRQNKKVKAAVGKWLTSCAEAPAPPPQEVDDETLTFAILTSLDHEEQPYFNALLSGSRELQPALRAPTPMIRKPRQDFLVRTGLALQRYYGLTQVPRDAETALYLVRNRHMHDLLRTVSDINPSEWELLVSGRFDGFLWSGADHSELFGEDGAITPTVTPAATGPDTTSSGNTTPSGSFAPFHRVHAMGPSPASPGGLPMRNFTPSSYFAHSRGPTPFSRGPTPASFVSGVSSMAGVIVPPGRAVSGKTAVTMDEELEVQVLAEVERHIYQGMEALENAFEVLHERAEQVRGALRQRTTGLQMGLQRKRAGAGFPSVHPNLSGGVAVEGVATNDFSPQWEQFGSCVYGNDDNGHNFALGSESDWGVDDFGELKPDDSASNISSSRHRRPKRRNERRTPAPIEEDYEEE